MNQSKIKEMKHVFMLVDLSSYIFYRNFALQKWKQAAKIDEETFSEEDFLAKYSYLFKDNLLKFKKKLKVPFENIILAKDCPRNEIWRNQVFADYKGTRTKPVQNFDPIIFKHTYDNLIPDLQKTYPLMLIEFQNAESDDVIAIVTKQIIQNPKNEVFILSLDNDFLQLETSNVKLLDFQMKPLNIKPAVKDILDIYLQWKIIYGDKSDNIPAIQERIGPKTAEMLAKDKSLLDERLMIDAVRKNYDRNNILINFEMIPEYIQIGVKETYLKLTKKN